MKKVRLIAAICALIAVGAFAWFFLNNGKPAEPEVKKVSVVTAKTLIPEYTVITKDMLEIVQVDEDALSPSAITKTEDAVGKIATDRILPKEQIVSLRLVADEGDKASVFSFKIKEGFRAFSLSVAMDRGVSYLLSPGSHVDVVLLKDTHLGILEFDEETEGMPEAVLTTIEKLRGIGMQPKKDTMNTAEEETEENIYDRLYLRNVDYLMQNVNVLSVDYKYKPAAEGEELYEYATVVLELDPEQVLLLEAACRLEEEGSGRLRLVMRRSGDDQTVESSEYNEYYMK